MLTLNLEHEGSGTTKGNSKDIKPQKHWWCRNSNTSNLIPLSGAQTNTPNFQCVTEALTKWLTPFSNYPLYSEGVNVLNKGKP